MEGSSEEGKEQEEDDVLPPAHDTTPDPDDDDDDDDDDGEREEQEEDIEMEEDDEGEEGHPSVAKKRRVEARGLMGIFDRLTRRQPTALWTLSTLSRPPRKSTPNLQPLKDHRHPRRPLVDRTSFRRM